MALRSGTGGWSNRGRGADAETQAGGAGAALGQDESYLVSVSDLMVGLLFLFIIILMAFALNFRSAEDAAEATLAELVVERDQLALEQVGQVLVERDHPVL